MLSPEDLEQIFIEAMTNQPPVIRTEEALKQRERFDAEIKEARDNNIRLEIPFEWM